MARNIVKAVRGLFGQQGGPKIAVNLKPRRSPWGGGNQFVEQFERRLAEEGYSVVFRLDEDVRCIFLIDPRPEASTAFKMAAIRSFKERHPDIPIVHRINECDRRKGTTGVDKALGDANAVVDFTVFISEWLKDYFIERWFDPSRPHMVIGNGADPSIFFPRAEMNESLSPFRLVTHHWSDNWMKGFKVYREVDRMIADGELPDVALSVIGRWPREIRWRSAELHGPTRGGELADLLRRHHAYLTASLWEPCGMHHIEGAQCGLPLIYHKDGGGIVEFGKRYGIGFTDNVRAAVLEAKDNYGALRSGVLADPPSGARMVGQYLSVVKRLLPLIEPQ